MRWQQSFIYAFSITVKPTTVTILEKPSFVSAGKEIKVVCQSLGGYPPPKLTWWLGSKMLKSNDEVTTKYHDLMHSKYSL
jgi:hypothetical protein